MSKNFDTLKEAFPIFKVRNKKNVSKNILLANNEEIVVPPLTSVRIKSEDLIQVPDATIFKIEHPPMDALIEHNVIKSGNTPAETPKKEENNATEKTGSSGNKS